MLGKLFFLLLGNVEGLAVHASFLWCHFLVAGKPGIAAALVYPGQGYIPTSLLQFVCTNRDAGRLKDYVTKQARDISVYIQQTNIWIRHFRPSVVSPSPRRLGRATRTRHRTGTRAPTTTSPTASASTITPTTPGPREAGDSPRRGDSTRLSGLSTSLSLSLSLSRPKSPPIPGPADGAVDPPDPPSLRPGGPPGPLLQPLIGAAPAPAEPLIEISVGTVTLLGRSTARR